MTFRLLVLFCGLFSVHLYAVAYSDYDVDGVIDSIDKCPNTSFDVLVDEMGCPEGYSYRGSINLLFGTLSSFNKDSNTSSSAQFLATYTYNKWDISVSSDKVFQNKLPKNNETIYVTAGYTPENSYGMDTKISIGTKVSSRQNDYFGMIDVGYDIQDNRHLFTSYAYTIATDDNLTYFNNYHTLSLGIGQSLNAHWHTALSVDYSGASTDQNDDYVALNWSNTFAVSSRFYIFTQYSYGLSNGASDHTLSLLLGLKID